MARSINNILNLRDNFTSGILRATKSTQTFTNQMKNVTKQTIEFKQKVTGTFTGIAGKVAGALAVVGIADFVKESISYTSDLIEVQNVVDKTFGNSANAINVWAKKANDAYGLTELQAKNYASTIGSMFKSQGVAGKGLVTLSEGVAGLAGDLASFKNLGLDEAFDKLKSGISGETEPLRSLGYDVSETTMKHFAMAQGIKKSWESMSQGEKMVLRYKSILSQMGDVKADYKTSLFASFANQLRTLKNNVTKTGGDIFGGLVPRLLELAKKANNTFKNINTKSLSDGVIKAFDTVYSIAVPIFKGIRQAIIDNLPVINSIKNNLIQLGTNIFNQLKVNASNNLGSIFTTLLRIADSVTSVAAKFAGWSGFIPTLQGLVIAMTAYQMALIGVTIAQNAAIIIGSLSKLWEFATLIVSALAAGEGVLTVAQTALNLAMELNPIGLIIAGLTGLIAVIILCVTHWDSITNAVKGFFNWMGNIITNAPDWALALTGPLAPILLLIKHFDDLKKAAQWAWDSIKKIFGFNGSANISVNTSGGEIGHNANGTNNWRGGWTWVGEKGAELVNLPGGSKVIPNNKINQATSNTPVNPNVNIHIYNNGGEITEPDKLNKITKAVLQALYNDVGTAHLTLG